MKIIGIDENGLGPQLGPLIATAALVEVEDYDAPVLAKMGRAAGIHDSKATSAFGKMRRAESLSLAVSERLSGSVPKTADDLLNALELEGVDVLSARCPSGSRSQCWGEALTLPAFGGDPEEGHRSLDALDKAGVRLLRVQTALCCVSAFNGLLDEGRSKLDVDLNLFERLIIDGRQSIDEPLMAICGMVGGIRRYRPRLRYLGSEPGSPEVECIEEVKGCSSYRLEGIGEIRFEVSSDANHLPVALASMVGKYVRELSMERQNRFYQKHDPDLLRVSGYHDPKTKAFVTSSAPLRLRLRIDEGCFRRNR